MRDRGSENQFHVVCFVSGNVELQLSCDSISNRFVSIFLEIAFYFLGDPSKFCSLRGREAGGKIELIELFVLFFAKSDFDFLENI